MDAKKETEQKIAKLQLLEQNLQTFLIQRQEFQKQVMELESALEGLKTSDENYKIIGNIMVKSDKDTLEKELKQKKEMIDLRISAIEKQENQIKEKAEEMQKEVLKDMEKKE